MSDFVLDASVSLSWFVDNPLPDAARKAREFLLKGQIALVPALWLFEMANGFVTAERREVLTGIEVSACCDEVEILLAGNLEIATLHQRSMVRDMASSARRHFLTANDASYLELALKESLPLMTLDRTLQAAARKAGVQLLP